MAYLSYKIVNKITSFNWLPAYLKTKKSKKICFEQIGKYANENITVIKYVSWFVITVTVVVFKADIPLSDLILYFISNNIFFIGLKDVPP